METPSKNESCASRPSSIFFLLSFQRTTAVACTVGWKVRQAGRPRWKAYGGRAVCPSVDCFSRADRVSFACRPVGTTCRPVGMTLSTVYKGGFGTKSVSLVGGDYDVDCSRYDHCRPLSTVFGPVSFGLSTVAGDWTHVGRQSVRGSRHEKDTL